MGCLRLFQSEVYANCCPSCTESKEPGSLKRKNENYIEIEVSNEDYKKIMNLDEFDIERKMLQTSAAQYIRISLRPEHILTKMDDQKVGEMIIKAVKSLYLNH